MTNMQPNFTVEEENEALISFLVIAQQLPSCERGDSCAII